MKKVLLGAVLGGLIGLLPALIYLRQLSSWETWNRDLFYVLLACGLAILGAVVGTTQAILQGFKDRHGRSARREGSGLELLQFFWKKPPGMHPKQWRSRRLGLGVALVALALAGIVLALKMLLH